jgi:tungstate transport system ATP-binding protein
LAIVGASGSGKTTLLKILAGLETPSSGEVLLDGKKTDQSELRMKSTMVFQKTVIFNTTVFDNVAYGLRIRSLPEENIKTQVEQVLKTVGLEDLEHRKAKRVSGGEQQRVSLARALVLKPEILLLDEPTANLDPANAFIVERTIAEAQRTLNQTIILATHNLDQAKRLSDEVAHMLGGEVVDKALVKDFFSNPKDPRTKRFVAGELPI